MGGTGLAFSQNIFEDILNLTGVESVFFADSANKYQDLPFNLLKLDLCANAVIGRKWKEVALNDQNQSVVTSQKSK